MAYTRNPTWQDSPSIVTPINAATLNNLEGGLVTAAGVADGNTAALARTPDALIVGTVTRDANGAATTAPVVWPNGTPGTYTATTVSTAFPGAVDAYTITYGSPVTRTYTQPAVTRNASGATISVPAVTVA